MFFRIISFFLWLSVDLSIVGQTENYSIRKTSFSSDKYDEFSPVFYRKGVVFCSNRYSGLLFNYFTNENKNLFKIFYAGPEGNPELFSGSLSTQFNDGPVTFNSSGDTVYFSRNIKSSANPWNASDARNKLGIFFAVLSGGKWKNVTELRFNSESYNVTTPWLSRDGKRLYFASDKPGGFGGSDLYYCEWKDNYWNNPVNMGNIINTGGNEAYPFTNDYGELLFSSDGHPGLGKKDIFYSKFIDSAWIEPVGLTAPINSEFDDFGLICDNEMTEGYFTSGRGKSFDIYSFKTLIPQFFYCSEQKVNRFCFSFQDNMAIDIDPVSLQFVWDFGDGQSAEGYVAGHCFKGPGNYAVKQNIIERKSGRIVFNKMSYVLELKQIIQPFISYNENTTSLNEITFDGSKSFLPGYKIISYSWDFGDGSGKEGQIVKHSFSENSEYKVRLGVQAEEINTGLVSKMCVTRKLSFKENMQASEVNSRKKKEIMPEMKKYDNVNMIFSYSAEKALSEKAIFQVELMTSKTRIKPDDNIFSKIGPVYTVRERYLGDEKIYSYVIDEGLVFMDVYPAFRDVASVNFKNARIKTFVPSDQAERELWNIKRQYAMSSDLFFNKDESRLKQGDFTVLDQIAVLLKKNTDVKLEIAVHTDNASSEDQNIKLSQSRAANIANYLIGKGVTQIRLKPAGYGSKKPVASNYSEADRKKNRRIDFVIIN